MPTRLICRIRLFCTAIALVLSCCVSSAQVGQDCDNAVQVCYASFTQNVIPAGFGAVQELNYPGSTNCLASGEQNSSWYIFTVNTTGQLEFEVDPLVYTNDYDWAVFDITTAGCAGIPAGTAIEIACNYSVFPGPTGMNSGGQSITNATPLDSNFIASVEVMANRTYALVINNSSLSTSGYNLNFTGSAGLLDNTLAEPIDILHRDCDQTDTLVITLSEPVLCTSLAPDGSDFLFTGPSVGLPYAAYAENCLAGGLLTNQVTVLLTSPIMANGIYSLSLKNGTDGNTLLDLCGNASPVGTGMPFVVTNLPTVELGNDTALCDGDVLTLSAGHGYNYTWSTGAHSQSIDVVEVPTIVWVQVSRPDGCTARDSIILGSACSIFVPNAFSPNGDGLNDVFTFISPHVATMEMIIYNRMGHRVYYSVRTAEAWDGTDGWGTAYPAGVYVYWLRGTFRSGKSFLKTGNVALIR